LRASGKKRHRKQWGRKGQEGNRKEGWEASVPRCNTAGLTLSKPTGVQKLGNKGWYEQRKSQGKGGAVRVTDDTGTFSLETGHLPGEMVRIGNVRLCKLKKGHEVDQQWFSLGG